MRSTATINAITTRATTLRASREHPPSSRLQATCDHPSGPPAWRSRITRVSKKAVRAPSQVFMLEVDAPATNGKGQDNDSNTRQYNQTSSKAKDPSNTGQTIVKLGAVGSIPMKVPKGQELNNHKSCDPASNKQQSPGATADDRRTERIFLSKESMARVRDAVEHDKLLPENATRDELRAY